MLLLREVKEDLYIITGKRLLHIAPQRLFKKNMLPLYLFTDQDYAFSQVLIIFNLSYT